MSSTWNKLENSTGEIKVSCSGEKWEKAQEKAFSKLAKNVKVPGFRDGQAPESLIKKQINDQAVLMEAVDLVASDCLMESLKEHDLDLVDRPELGIDKITTDAVEFTFKCVVRPEVKLGKYRAVKVKKDEVVVEDKQVDNRIEDLREQMAELLLKEEGMVENGNTVVIDFKGFLNDKEFDGGAADNYPLEIGSGSFIPGFEEQIVGMKTGEAKDINVTFPEQYQSKELAGQPVVFKVEVKEIKEKQLPEVNDDFAVSVDMKDVKTVDELKAAIKANLVDQATKSVDEKHHNDLLEKIVGDCECEIPAVMIEQETEYIYRDFVSRLAQQGYNEELFFNLSGQTKEQVKEDMSKDAANKVKLRLVLAAIAKEEKIAVEENEVVEEYQKIASQYKMDVDKVKEAIDEDTLREDIALQKAMDIIITTAA